MPSTQSIIQTHAYSRGQGRGCSPYLFSVPERGDSSQSHCRRSHVELRQERLLVASGVASLSRVMSQVCRKFNPASPADSADGWSPPQRPGLLIHGYSPLASAHNTCRAMKMQFYQLTDVIWRSTRICVKLEIPWEERTCSNSNAERDCSEK